MKKKIKKKIRVYVFPHAPDPTRRDFIHSTDATDDLTGSPRDVKRGVYVNVYNHAVAGGTRTSALQVFHWQKRKTYVLRQARMQNQFSGGGGKIFMQ